MKLIDDARICMIFFTRLPVTWPEDLPRERITRAFQAAPVVGLVTGLIGAVIYWLAFTVTGGSVYLAATLAVAAQILATGAFHEDGLADFFDGLGAATPEARLEVMRDSRLGTFGALALGLAVLLKVLLVAEIAIPWQAGLILIATGAISRAALVQVMARVAPAAADGQSAAAGQPTTLEAGAALVFGGAIAGAALVLGTGLGFILPALGGLAGTVLGAAAIAWVARRHLGGQTGDVLGAVAVTAELGALMGIVALLPAFGV